MSDEKLLLCPECHDARLVKVFWTIEMYRCPACDWECSASVYGLHATIWRLEEMLRDRHEDVEFEHARAEKAERERDEARARAERLEQAGLSLAAADPSVLDTTAVSAVAGALEDNAQKARVAFEQKRDEGFRKLIAERDALRQEVERLRRPESGRIVALGGEVVEASEAYRRMLEERKNAHALQSRLDAALDALRHAENFLLSDDGLESEPVLAMRTIRAALAAAEEEVRKDGN